MFGTLEGTEAGTAGAGREMPMSQAGTADEWSVDLAYTAGALRAGRKTILWTTLGTTALAILYALAAPPYYTATAAFIAQTPSTLSSGLLSEMSSMGVSSLLGGASKGTGDLYVGILKSRSIADRMNERFSLMRVYRVKKRSLAEAALAKHSKFDVDIKSSIITIQVTDDSPERARDIANGYLDELRLTNQRLALTESSQRRLFFEQQLANEKNALANAEVDLKRSQERTGLIAPAAQTSLEIQSIAQVRAQIAAHEVQLASIRKSSTDQNPVVIQALAEIDDLRRQLATMQSGKSEGKVGDLAASEVPALGLEYVRKEREVKYHEALFGLLLKQYESAKMDESREPQLLQVLDQAVSPDTKTGPHRMLLVLSGLVLGLLGGGLWILFQAARKRMKQGGSSSSVSTNDIA